MHRVLRTGSGGALGEWRSVRDRACASSQQGKLPSSSQRSGSSPRSPSATARLSCCTAGWAKTRRPLPRLQLPQLSRRARGLLMHRRRRARLRHTITDRQILHQLLRFVQSQALTLHRPLEPSKRLITISAVLLLDRCRHLRCRVHMAAFYEHCSQPQRRSDSLRCCTNAVCVCMMPGAYMCTGFAHRCNVSLSPV